MARPPGRPRLASAAMLQEAAFELFQVRGYRATSVELIAKTAGFSRATFFNFFPSKAELFWVETDALLAALRAFLREQLGAPGQASPETVRDVILAYADTLTSASIPWALKNYRLLEGEVDLTASGASRVLDITRTLGRYLDAGDAAALTARLLVGLLDWVDAGVARGSLRERLVHTL